MAQHCIMLGLNGVVDAVGCSVRRSTHTLYHADLRIKEIGGDTGAVKACERNVDSVVRRVHPRYKSSLREQPRCRGGLRYRQDVDIS